jgi:hypothetical protein
VRSELFLFLRLALYFLALTVLFLSLFLCVHRTRSWVGRSERITNRNPSANYAGNAVRPLFLSGG